MSLLSRDMSFTAVPQQYNAILKHCLLATMCEISQGDKILTKIGTSWVEIETGEQI